MAAPISLCLQFLCFAFITIITQTRADDTLGAWAVLVPNAGISSMHTAVTHWNTVVLLDRTNIGASKLMLPNGVCRDNPKDQSLTHDCYAHSAVLSLKENSIRPLEIFTDTWCSSGQFLADGTLLQTGGFSDGDQKIRQFTPCKPTQYCDWYERPDIQLSSGRWYATNQILPNGDIIIVGGIGVNSVEYYPSRGGSVEFDFLGTAGDDQGDNLYPFVHLLPSGKLFIFVNTQSVLYDPDTNVVLQNYPQLEGGPRNYPSAGSSVMLALKPANYYTATIVVCGGAQLDAYKNGDTTAPATQSCGRIVATDPNPAWEMDYMPFPRNMGDMVMLPTGGVVIINGAQAGSQGFGGATNPALTPVLYQPDQPLGFRFTELNAGTVPRLYHSTANLLPDGRILLAGSNTHYYYTYDGIYPTELSIEAFSPPYLAAGIAYLRPVVVKTPKAVKYGKAYNVFVTVPSPITGTVEVNFASSPFTTHSFSQGQRLVKLEVTNVYNVNGQYQIVFNAPPDNVVAPPGYYMMFVVNGGVPSVARWVPLGY